MKVEPISLDLIRTDGGTQMRAELDQEVYLNYRDLWLSGVEFDPSDVFHDGSVYWLADGFHRFYGAREAKRASLPCRVHQGTQRDAILFAAGANALHGLRRTNADKRLAVLTLLGDGEWVSWSDGVISDKCAVSQNFVSEIRRQLKSDLSSVASKVLDDTRIGRDGRKRRPSRRPSREPGEDRTESRHKPAPEPAPDETPFDAHVLRCDTVVQTYVPKVQEFAIEIERLLDNAKGDFSAKRISGAAKVIFEQFEGVRRVLLNAQKRHLRKAK